MSPEPSDDTWTPAEEEIMQATFRAFLSHGYADLSIARIAAELGKSKAALYYHYDSKDDLLVAFLEYAIHRFETLANTELDGDPRENLERVVEKLLPLDADEKSQQVQTVLVELRAQAVSNDAVREQFTRLDEKIVATIRDIVRDGVEEGVFREVDATRVAEHLYATISGTRYADATTDREAALAATRVSLSAYIDSELRPEST